MLPSLTEPRLAMVEPAKLYVVPVANVPADTIAIVIWPAANVSVPPEISVALAVPLPSFIMSRLSMKEPLRL